VAPPDDPRPLPGEPLALDLLNTEVLGDDGPEDLLADPATRAAWLRHACGPGPGHAGSDAAPDLDDAGDALVAARAAIRRVVEAVAAGRRPSPGERAALDAVLAHGRVERRLGEDGWPVTEVRADDPAHGPGVRAAHDLLDLLGDRPERLRQCEHERCVLWFLDTSRNGTRRWCSMASCGNRAKAARHYRRARQG
jgi:predicted RNA-binding Zn ribbon-like protein